MADDEGGGKAIGAAAGGLGVGAMLLVRICGEAAPVVDDVARVGARAGEVVAGATLGDDAVRAAGGMADDWAGAVADAERAAAAAPADEAGIGLRDVAEHALDAADVADLASAATGGPGATWLGEPKSLAALSEAMPVDAGLVGFVVRQDAAGLHVGADLAFRPALDALCRAAHDTCKVYVLPAGAPASAAGPPAGAEVWTLGT